MEAEVTKDLNQHLKIVWIELPEGQCELALMETISGHLIGFEPDSIITDILTIIKIKRNGFCIGCHIFLLDATPKHTERNHYRLEAA